MKMKTSESIFATETNLRYRSKRKNSLGGEMGKRVAEEEGQGSKLLVEGKPVCRQVVHTPTI